LLYDTTYSKKKQVEAAKKLRNLRGENSLFIDFQKMRRCFLEKCAKSLAFAVWVSVNDVGVHNSNIQYIIPLYMKEEIQYVKKR